MRLFLFLSLFCFSLQAFSFTSGFQLFLLGSRSLAKGKTGTSYAGSGSTIFFNPGAVAFSSSQLSIGANLAVPTTAYLEPNPGIEFTISEPAYVTPFYFYGIFRPTESSPLAFGLSINSPYGQAIAWPRSWTGRFISLAHQRNSIFIQPTVSVRLGSGWGIGGGLVIGRTSVFQKRALANVGTPQTGVDPTVSLSSSGTELGFNVGMYARPTADLQLGLSFRSALIDSDAEGIATFDVPASVASQFPDKSFSTQEKLPAVVSGGLTYQAQKGLLLTFEMNYTLWSIYDSLLFFFEEEIQPDDAFGTTPNYENTFSYRIGSEIQLNQSLDLLLGFYYDISPVMDGFVSPEMPDANQLGVTGGVSWELAKQIQVDAAFAFASTGERTATFEEKGFAGTYQTNTFAMSLGLSYVFAAR